LRRSGGRTGLRLLRCRLRGQRLADRRRASRRRRHPRHRQGAGAHRARHAWIVKGKPVAESYDVIIIGSGPGGYVTAIRAAQLGLKTAIVEREHLGGICSNWGCIPAKALLRSSEIMHYATHPEAYGLKIDGKVSADVKAVVERSRGVAQRMNNGVGLLMKKNKVDVIWGEAKLTKAPSGEKAGEITVSRPAKKPMQPQAPAPKNTKGEGSYTARHIIVAT